MAGGNGTRLVATTCDGCVIRLLCFYGDPDPRWNWVDVQLVSNHRQRDHTRWRSRVRNAWAALRDRYDRSGFQLDTNDHALAFRTALDVAIEETWPHASADQHERDA